jgi:uncharacterized membrane protein
MNFDSNVGFLRFKQDYIENKLWKAAFYIHVFSAIFLLLAGFTQFSDHIQKEYKKVHRFLGRLYVFNILLINFPAAMIMAVYANGLLPSKIAFIILDSLWFFFTLKGIIEARKKNFNSHRDFMIRSYALTFSAITLRTWKLILTTSFPLDPLTIYMMDAWLGFVPNLLLAEWIILRKRRRRLAFKRNGIKNNQEGNK